MHYYALYDPATGALLQCGYAPQLDGQARPGTQLLELTAEQWAEIEGTELDLHQVVDGELQPVDATTADARTTARAWAAVRQRRAQLLLESDWTETPSAAQRMAPEALAAWQAYRQALRDITDQPGPDVAWPTPPTT